MYVCEYELGVLSGGPYTKHYNMYIGVYFGAPTMCVSIYACRMFTGCMSGCAYARMHIFAFARMVAAYVRRYVGR